MRMYRKTKIPSFYFDVNLSAKHWGLNGPHMYVSYVVNKYVVIIIIIITQYRYHHTPPINTLFGLRETLTIIAQEVAQYLILKIFMWRFDWSNWKVNR